MRWWTVFPYAGDILTDVRNDASYSVVTHDNHSFLHAYVEPGRDGSAYSHQALD